MTRSFVLLLVLPLFALAQEKSCVRIVHLSKEGGGAGSGTVVSNKDGKCLILTNRHLVNSPEQRLWVVHEKKRYDARFVAKSDRVDLALIEVSLEADPVVLAEYDPAEGEVLRHYGCSTGGSEGKRLPWITFVEKQGNIKTLQTSMWTIEGDSGAGVFNKDGKLVGVHYAGLGDRLKETRTSAVRLEEVRHFLKPYLN